MRLCGVIPYKSLNFATFFSIDENRGANNPAIDNVRQFHDNSNNNFGLNAPLIDVGAPNTANNPAANVMRINNVEINAALIDVDAPNDGAPNDGADNPSADKFHVNLINNEELSPPLHDIGIPVDGGNKFVFPLQEIAATDAYRCSKRAVASKKKRESIVPPARIWPHDGFRGRQMSEFFVLIYEITKFINFFCNTHNEI